MIILEHDLNITAKLTALGVVDTADPALRALGGSLVTAELDLRRALARLAPLVGGAAPLDTADPADLAEAADALTRYQRALGHVRKAVTSPRFDV